MRKTTVFAMLLIIAINSFSQQANPSRTPMTEDYLKKSKHQKTAAWAFLGGGAALFITGLVIPQGEQQWDDYFLVPVEGHKNDGVKGAFYLVGTLSMLGSIPFFIASGK